MKKSISKKSSHILIKLSGVISQEDVRELKNLLSSNSKYSLPVILDIRQAKSVHYKTGLLLKGMRKYFLSRCIPLTIICTDPYTLSVLSLFDSEVMYDTTKNLNSARNLVEIKF
ncbi:MAG: hypothetical protein COX48_03225 [bacterium (Candidatus Stahlbacteria) CG23_combo_of_CG06-09_8_20_14_all_34_7]|nr:MAG: hypothetical protein COX48_03225 [bacterium (Candidatus Stahlbacteria) CG23_combo_of_CG06-09_8_20_14_all_34_7]